MSEEYSGIKDWMRELDTDDNELIVDRARLHALVEATGPLVWLGPGAMTSDCGRLLVTFTPVAATPYRALVADWVTRHGIDSHTVPMFGTILRDVEGRRIYYSAFVWHTGADGRRHIMLREDGIAQALIVNKVQQLESPPSPFPLYPKEI